jgi:hypothetical protein
MKTHFCVLVKAEIGVGWVVMDGGGQMGSNCAAVANVALRL